MPFAMLYPPNMAALPDIPYQYPHFCSNPRPRFSGVPQPREPPPPRRQSTTHTNCSATRRRDSQPKEPKSSFWDCVGASLGGFGLVYSNFTIPAPIYGTNWTTPRPSPAHAATQESRPAPQSSATRFQELFGEAEKAKGRKRQKVKKYGTRFGGWVGNFCGRKKQREEHLTQPLSGGQEGGEPKRESKILGRRVSASSDMTLVETLEKRTRDHPPTPPPRSSRRHMVYTGH